MSKNIHLHNGMLAKVEICPGNPSFPFESLRVYQCMKGSKSQKKWLIHKRRMWKKIYYKFYKHNYTNVKKKFDDDPFHPDERRAREYWHHLFKIIRETIQPHFNTSIYFTEKSL